MQKKEETFPKRRVGADAYARGMTAARPFPPVLGGARRHSAALGRAATPPSPPGPVSPAHTLRVWVHVSRSITSPASFYAATGKTSQDLRSPRRRTHCPKRRCNGRVFGECHEWIPHRYSGENPTNGREKGRREGKRDREWVRGGQSECGSWSISQCVPPRCFLSTVSRRRSPLLCHRPRVPADSDSRNSRGTPERSPRCCRRHLTSSRLRWTR